MKHPSSLHFRPRVENLEDRCTPSGLGGAHANSHLYGPYSGPLVDGPHPADFSHMSAPGPDHSDVRVVPFHVTGGGPAPEGIALAPFVPVPHLATGTGTELGRYTGEGMFQHGPLNISATGEVTAAFQGSFVFVAANGDRLATNYGSGFTGVMTGQLTSDGTAITNITFVAVFTPDPAHSTGRFADVVGGGWLMIAHADYVSLQGNMPGYTAPFDYTWSGEGALVFSKGK